MYPPAPDGLARIGERLLAGLADPSVERPLGHLLGAGALGFLGGLAPGPASARARWVGIALFWVCIEGLQAAAPTRHPRGGDLLLDLVASALAWGGARALVRRSEGLRRLRAGAGVARGLTLAGALCACAAVVLHERDLSFTSWDPSHGFAIGDEWTGDRPWRGTLAGLAVYPVALDAATVARLARTGFDPAGIAVRRQLGAVVLYDFAGPWGGLGDRSAHAPPLALSQGAARRDAEAGLLLGEGRVVRAERTGKLHAAITRDSALSVEWVGRSGASPQRGPARIVTFSASPLRRNFTAGQQGDALVFRLRTPPNGKNGLVRPVAWPGFFEDDRLHHGVVTYARAELAAYRDGEPRVPRQRLDWPASRFPRIPLARPFAAGLLLFLPLAALASLGWPAARPWRRRAVEAAVGGAACAAATLVGVVAFGTTWDPTLPAVAALTLPLCDAWLSRQGSAPSPAPRAR